MDLDPLLLLAKLGWSLLSHSFPLARVLFTQQKLFCFLSFLLRLKKSFRSHYKMLRRFSTKVGLSKDKRGDTNGTTNGINGPSNGAATDKPKMDKRSSSFMPHKAPQKTKRENMDHTASRADVEASFTQFAQLIHASKVPLPTQTGDGGLVDHAEPSGLLADIKAMGFKDAKTLMNVMKTKATGELQDDKTYLMEQTIQVCKGRHQTYT